MKNSIKLRLTKRNEEKKEKYPMRYLITSILVFITTNCFAINQKLINEVNRYEIAINILEKIELGIKTKSKTLESWLKDLDEEKNKVGIFRSDDMIKFYQLRSDETRNEINNLNTQYAQTKKIIKKLEPAKAEYDKREEKERKWDKFKTKISNIVGMSIMPLGFVLILWISIRQQKKYKRLLKEGKITQEEYDRIMTRHASSTSNNNTGINPATGLPMTGIGISDVGGNVRGSSSSSSSFDYLQDCRNRHRWD